MTCFSSATVVLMILLMLPRVSSTISCPQAYGAIAPCRQYLQWEGGCPLRAAAEFVNWYQRGTALQTPGSSAAASTSPSPLASQDLILFFQTFCRGYMGSPLLSRSALSTSSFWGRAGCKCTSWQRLLRLHRLLVKFKSYSVCTLKSFIYSKRYCLKL